MFSNWFLFHFQANSGTSAQGRWRSWLTLTHQTRIKKKNSDTVGDQQRGSEGLPLPSPPGRVYLPINIAVSQSNYTHKFLERYQDTWAKGNVCEQTCSLNCNRQNPETNHRPIEHSVCRQNAAPPPTEPISNNRNRFLLAFHEDGPEKNPKKECQSMRAYVELLHFCKLSRKEKNDTDRKPWRRGEGGWALKSCHTIWCAWTFETLSGIRQMNEFCEKHHTSFLENKAVKTTSKS